MIILSGADLVLPDRILSPGTLVIEGDRIGDIRPGGSADLRGHTIIPGLIDVHVHGVDGVDSLDVESVHGESTVTGDGSIEAIAARLVRYGVTAFCPTTVACAPDALRRVLRQIRRSRESPTPAAARVLPAHLESNFINPQYRGAQPAACLRVPGQGAPAERVGHGTQDGIAPWFTAGDILREVEDGGTDIGIVTLAPELDGAIDLIARLTARHLLVSLGHSGATYEQTLLAIAAGARHATHLFNCMPPFHHRTPTMPAAILDSEQVAAELICDGVHVHPAVVRVAVGAKGPNRIMAITDGTAASGVPAGAQARLGGQPITVGESAAFLADGTLAGSVMTMDRMLRTMVGKMGVPLGTAVTMCSTTPAHELGLAGLGEVTVGALADLVVLDSRLSVVETYVGGRVVYSRNTSAPESV
jgi:N-acetylglucosamine-6-phosphate deacetylase